MKQYNVVTSTNVFEFNENLNKKINAGWAIEGSLIVTSAGAQKGHSNSSLFTEFVTTYSILLSK